MNLDLDVGNTRLKWRTVDDRGALIANGVQRDGNVEGLAELGLKPRRVRVACVRDKHFRDNLGAKIETLWGVRAEFAATQAQAGGVRNAYTHPQHLGVDRWLSLLAAMARAGRDCCVVDAGSALTVDLLREDGQHLGGFIVPGLTMQRASLLERTAIRLPEPAAWGALQPGLSTSEAIHHGILSMTLTWLLATSESVRNAGGALYLAGGDAPLLSLHFKERGIAHEVIADLVLEGLAIALP